MSNLATIITILIVALYLLASDWIATHAQAEPPPVERIKEPHKSVTYTSMFTVVPKGTAPPPPKAKPLPGSPEWWASIASEGEE